MSTAAAAGWGASWRHHGFGRGAGDPWLAMGERRRIPATETHGVPFAGGGFRPSFGGHIPNPWGGPPFRSGPKVGRGDVRAAVLVVLADGPLHGYQIIQEIAERSGGVWRPSPGSVYPAVQQLADEGLVRVEETGVRRVVHLTDAGRTYVEENAAELTAVWDTVSDGVPEGVMELRDLIGQVAAAVMQVAHAGSEAQLAQAGKILSATRRSLYRLLADDNGSPTTTEEET